MSYMPLFQRQRLLLLLMLLAGTIVAHAQVFDEDYSHWPEQLRINGQVVIHNGLTKIDTIKPVLQRVVRTDGHHVYIAANQDGQWLQTIEGLSDDGENLTTITSLQPPAELLEAAIASADCLYIDQGAINHELLHALQPALNQLLQRGDALVVHTSTAASLGKLRVTSAQGEAPRTEPGLNLLPDCVLQHGNIQRDDLLRVVSEHPRTVGVSLGEDSAVLLSGRKITCYGSGKATFLLPAAAGKPARIESIAAQNSRRRAPESYMVDLTEWRRDAIDRDLPPFPPAVPQSPRVDQGTLLIVGGGGTPRGLSRRFVELAGGTEEARLVYVPCSENSDVGQRHGMVESWKRMGVKHATFIHTKDRRKANTDEEFLAALKDATGIYFGGGRQWNFSDSYYGTRAHKLMKDVLYRGGVIAGSSAGASIQARYLARATPIGNSRIMAPGYERGGLGFISGVAIDQHFTQRGRQKDMTQLMQVHPQLLGIGLDEATAIEVQQSIAKVSGRGHVYFYDAHAERDADDPDYVALSADSIYDLASRKVILSATESTSEITGDNESIQE